MFIISAELSVWPFTNKINHSKKICDNIIRSVTYTINLISITAMNLIMEKFESELSMIVIFTFSSPDIRSRRDNYTENMI